MSSLFSLLLSILLLSPKPSTAFLPRAKLTTSDPQKPQNFHPRSHSQSPSPTKFFEVTRPISKPSSNCLSPSSPTISPANLRHAPTATRYSPPFCLPPRLRRALGHPPRSSAGPSTCSAASRPTSIFGVWLSGVELLRSCTAEPRPDPGIAWTVEKDITRYSSLLSHPQTLAVYVGNLVDKTYTGIYHVNLSIEFYFGEPNKPKMPNVAPGFNSPADLVMPVSRPLPLNDGQWFEVQNSADLQTSEVLFPKNVYRAVLEVYVSFHQNDEFWYTNPPNEYIEKNNISLAGNGAFREVVVSLDGSVVGAVWPFTVIYTGGVNPLLWRPITGIGSFDLPSYDIEITPFLERVLDGKKHVLGFGVSDALDVWYVDANLHLWLDSRSKKTVGELIKYTAPQIELSLISKFNGLDGRFDTVVKREISATGWVKSSYGKITTHFFQTFDFKNYMEFKGNGSDQIVNQTIDFNHGVYAKHPSSVVYSEQVFQNFPLYLYTGTSDQVNDTYSLVSNVTLGFNEKKFSGEKFGFASSNLRNLQNAQGSMHVKGNLVTGGLGSTQQVYKYEGTDGCYFRNVSSRNYTVLYDESGGSCTERLGYF
ncbi:uncharacterized protein A4U43_C06F12410 [Asparagus officinalis]|uniref:Peptide N-acetyl-beta-D-glucosaminyl asparaginase amidase A N-terminal domain-containing protein n=1 Tax=Asparagus officinalis TaxID=4686 RepID=A0A5P1ELN4_ASPOF|nr:uncharacterized protein A4U43_C06F12410 [Asparagus officinalis]